ncbi:NUDIX domain-containing protein [Companilactobacillus sp. HBUAS56275]|jgi:NTP pyrophosphohydrolases including oxidative damage repair enzymes|uniref:NUDIX domain-containing protein n=1 Tax=Candidatus Companilactobacillus pullicola TaxID=2838523 RepID=A0A9D1ZQI0_9LACO|nr:NUDIX domain-containing protein [Candidatus Companilactobacillus pullicola]
MQEQGDLRYFLTQKQKFDVRAVLILLHQNKVFVRQENTKRELYILPGGAIKFNEESQAAAEREAREELGLTDLKLEFAGILENFWKLKRIDYQQLNLIYRQEVSDETYHHLKYLDYRKFDLPPNSNMKWIKVDQAGEALQPRGIVKTCYPNIAIQHLVNHQNIGF